MLVQDSEQQTVYATGTLTQVAIYVTGLIKIENAKIVVLDSDLGSVETQKKYVETYLRCLVMILYVVFISFTDSC